MEIHIVFMGKKSQHNKDGISPKFRERFNVIPTKIPSRCFVNIYSKIYLEK